MSKNLTLALTVSALALIFGGVLFVLTRQEQVPTITPPPQEETQEEPTPTQGEVRKFTVEGDEYSFSPTSITVRQGERVRITFVNVGRISHTYTISSLGVDTGLAAPGRSKTVEFTAPSQTVTFESVCTVPGHKEAGMVGTVVVEE